MDDGRHGRPRYPPPARYREPVLGRILGGIGRVLITAGLFILGFVAFQLWGTGIETARGQSQLTESLAAEVEGADATTVDLTSLSEQLAERDPATAPPTPPPPEGEPVGVIAIPRIGLEAVVVEGVSKEDLKKGPGHYPGTPLPGQAGNAGVAGHRTTYGAPFNRIDELEPGDEIRVVTPQGGFTYEVVPAPGTPEQAWYAVLPSQVEVLDDMGDNRITLTACHPKYSARERIIVHAVLQTTPAPAVELTSTSDEPAAQATAAEFDEGLDGDAAALTPAVLFGLAAAAVLLLAWFLARYARKWFVYLLAAPAVGVLVWFSYVNLDRYLPAL